MNKVIAVTGGTSGVGKSLAFKLAEKGCVVVILARNKLKAERAVYEITEKSGNAKVSYILCDLAEKKSVSDAAEELKKNYEKLDVLVNNAGITVPRLEFTDEGIEKTFAVNHLGHFYLTYLLREMLVDSAPSRIINVASQAHRKIDFTILSGMKNYNQFRAYAYSKTANILFTFELAKRLEGKNVAVNCVHPGVVNTAIYDNVPFHSRILINFMRLFFISPEKSADRIIPLILSEKYGNITGRYFINLKDSLPKTGTTGSNDAIRLWELSNKLLNINF